MRKSPTLGANPWLFCGLRFEPACLEFHKTKRDVRTASSEQVRQPISREGLDQWRNYEPWLGALEDGLGDALNPQWLRAMLC